MNRLEERRLELLQICDRQRGELDACLEDLDGKVQWLELAYSLLRMCGPTLSVALTVLGTLVAYKARTSLAPAGFLSRLSFGYQIFRRVRGLVDDLKSGRAVQRFLDV